MTNSQKALLKCAQRAAGVTDAEYRDMIEMIAGPGVRSSRDRRFLDSHLDKMLALLEAIFWRGVDAGQLQGGGSAPAVFRQRGYWAAKNNRQETSRDRYNGRNLGAEIKALEAELISLGFNHSYCAAIRRNVTKGRNDAHSMHLYQVALDRTVRTKRIGKFLHPDDPAAAAAFEVPVVNAQPDPESGDPF